MKIISREEGTQRLIAVIHRSFNYSNHYEDSKHKSEICRAAINVNRTCKYINCCDFAHEIQELRPRVFDTSNFKKAKCVNWWSGCQYGGRCLYIHDEKIFKLSEHMELLHSDKERKFRIVKDQGDGTVCVFSLHSDCRPKHASGKNLVDALWNFTRGNYHKLPKLPKNAIVNVSVNKKGNTNKKGKSVKSSQQNPKKNKDIPVPLPLKIIPGVICFDIPPEETEWEASNDTLEELKQREEVQISKIIDPSIYGQSSSTTNELALLRHLKPTSFEADVSRAPPPGFSFAPNNYDHKDIVFDQRSISKPTHINFESSRSKLNSQAAPYIPQNGGDYAHKGDNSANYYSYVEPSPPAVLYPCIVNYADQWLQNETYHPYITYQDKHTDPIPMTPPTNFTNGVILPSPELKFEEKFWQEDEHVDRKEASLSLSPSQSSRTSEDCKERSPGSVIRETSPDVRKVEKQDDLNENTSPKSSPQKMLKYLRSTLEEKNNTITTLRQELSHLRRQWTPERAT